MITSSPTPLFPYCCSGPPSTFNPPLGCTNFRLYHPLATSLSPTTTVFSLSPEILPTLTPPIQSRLSAIHFTSLPYMMSPPSNNVTLAVSASPTSSRASFPSQNDRERSRNAKAQARHRAKRKAYVEQVHHSPPDRFLVCFRFHTLSPFPPSSSKQSRGSKQR